MTLEDARSGAPIGCIELGIPGKDSGYLYYGSPNLASAMDLVMRMVYPIPNWGPPSEVGTIALMVPDFAPGKPVWLVAQAFGWSLGRALTASQVLEEPLNAPQIPALG